MSAPKIFGIVNLTPDSFSDGGKFLAVDTALSHARSLAAAGADFIDLGAVASNPDASRVSFQAEIERLAPLVDALKGSARISLDTYSIETQRWGLHQKIDWLNDIRGFPDPSFYDELASAKLGLVVMHNVSQSGRAERIETDPNTIMDRLFLFFDQRLNALISAGVSASRIVIDPGMGFFLGTDPEVSLTVLRNLSQLKNRFGRPVLISVSRKSFIRKLAGVDLHDAGAATLSAELFAANHGADYIRTHDVASLKHGLAVDRALRPK